MAYNDIFCILYALERSKETMIQVNILQSLYIWKNFGSITYQIETQNLRLIDKNKSGTYSDEGRAVLQSMNFLFLYFSQMFQYKIQKVKKISEKFLGNKTLID